MHNFQGLQLPLGINQLSSRLLVELPEQDPEPNDSIGTACTFRLLDTHHIQLFTLSMLQYSVAQAEGSPHSIGRRKDCLNVFERKRLTAFKTLGVPMQAILDPAK